MSPIVAPSLLSANFANLERDLVMVNESDADWLHVDVMDGVFVPNISLGFPIIRAVQKIIKKPMDVHLMIVNPDQYIKEFVDAGAFSLSVHFEACTHLHRTIQAIKQAGAKAGVAINPHTPVSALHDIIADIDLVCMMSVNPGFGGQKFIENTYHKITALKEIIALRHSKALIEIDGGVDLDNFQKLINTGADVLVAGNSVFTSKNPKETISRLKGQKALS